jgi:hypothetical protein
METALAVILRPLALVLIVALIGYPIRAFVWKRMKQSRLKDILFHRLY